MNLIMMIWIAQAVWAENTDYYHSKSIEFKSPRPNTDETHPEPYFGFSITFDKFNKHLIISSPTENVNGTVYDCNINRESCGIIDREIQRYSPVIYKHDYWFGATVKSGSTFVVACVPRFTKSIDKKTTGVYGECYMRNRDEPVFGKAIKLFIDPPTNKTGVELTMETLGWSMDIGNDDFLIVGGPGMNKKRGLAAILPNPAESSAMEMMRVESDPGIFNFGYGVAVGQLVEDAKYSFAVGSTYGKQGFGAVYFYKYDNEKLAGPFYLMKGEDITLVGSMYGAVLCAANLHNTIENIATDLLVGAPTYAEQSTVNAGAVYVYIRSTAKTPTFKKKINCQKSGAFFGSAIANVGDINGDGIEEIAIAAPYEDEGRGAVYLYSGADLSGDKSDKTLTWLQRFQPEGVRSFGLSLSALQDYDDNGCNELAIGAPYDNKVVLYNCMAAITLNKISAHFPNLQIRDRNIQDFKFKVCQHFKYPKKPKDIIAVISTDVIINHPNAKLSRPNKGNIFTYLTDLSEKKLQYCKEVDIVLPLDGNYGVNIGYKITTRLVINPMELKDFEENRVLLSDNSKLAHEDAIWAAECAGDKECNAILSIDLNPKIDHPFVTGSKDMMTLKIDVHNTGEIAYDPCIHLKILNATLYQTPMDCSKVEEMSDVYECTYRKPLKTNNTWTIDDVTLNLKALTSRHKKFAVNVTLFDHCKNDEKIKFQEFVVPLQNHNAGLDIKGTTNIGNIINMNVMDLRDGKQFVQIYTITNNGMTNFENLLTEVTIMKEKFISYSNNPVIILKEDKFDKGQLFRHNCNIKKNNNVEIIAECSVDSLPKTQFFKVLITMDIKPKSLEYKKLREQNVTVTSGLVLKVDSFSKPQSIITTIKVMETPVEIWILLLAVLVGILLLIILVIVLQMCGCLQRRNKQKLKNLKENVQRESVRRSMIHQRRNENCESTREPSEVYDNTDSNISLKGSFCGNTTGTI